MRRRATSAPRPVLPAPAITDLAPAVVPALALVECTCIAARQGLRVFALPFDAARELYARGVQTGLVPNSILAWRDVEVALDAMEKVTLGPLARRV